jgi:hypothetical protein
MKVKGCRFQFLTDPDTSERTLHVEDYHHSADALRGTELTAWFGRNVLSLCLRMAVLFALVVIALVGILRLQFARYCEAQGLK